VQSPDDVCVVDAEPVPGEQDAGGQALGMQAAPELRIETLPDPVRRKRKPGHDEDCGHPGERRQHPRGRAATEMKERERQQNNRVELRGKRGPEQPARDCAAPVDERRESTHRQQRRPGVVRVQRDRPERDRHEREEERGGADVQHACAPAREHERHAVDRCDRGERHQHLEQRVVRAVRRERGRGEERDRPGRILDEDVAVGQPPVEQRVAVLAVQVQVAELRAAEEPAARHRERAQEQRGRERRHPQGKPGRSSH